MVIKIEETLNSSDKLPLDEPNQKFTSIFLRKLRINTQCKLQSFWTPN